MQDMIIKMKDGTEVIVKFNPYHDAKGRFTSRNSHASFSPGKDATTAQRSIANENARRAKDGTDAAVAGKYYNVGKKPYAQVLQEYKEYQEKQKNPVVQTKPPVKPGKTVKWSNMSDDEFANSLEDYMPGLNTIATNGFAAKNPAMSYGYSRSTRNWVDNSQNGDMVLTDIYTARGFHAKPKLMTRDDIKDYITQNNTPELYRGMRASRSTGESGSKKQDNFINGAFNFAGSSDSGSGAIGNGTYAAETPKGSYRNTGLRTARAYARGEQDAIVRMTYEKNAKTVTAATMLSQRREFSNKVDSAVRNGKIDSKMGQTYKDIASDIGRFAALRGYDVIIDKGGHSGASKYDPYHNVLNRGKLIIQSDKRYS